MVELRPHRKYEKRFDWKFQAKEFRTELKQKAKRRQCTVDGETYYPDAYKQIVVKIEPEIKFISTIKHNESRIVGYYVTWYYKW